MLVLWHPDTLTHPSPPGFPESPDRVRAIVTGLEARGHQIDIPVLDLDRTRRLAEVVHGATYLRRFEAAARRGDGLLDSADNPLTPETFGAALAAAAVAVEAVVRARPTDPVFAAIRPPGHHCERETAMGFCYLANAAIAVAAAREQGLARIAIYDFDVHHGNGTQHLFEADAETLFVSSHQYPFYPGSGSAQERGIGAGVGATVNVPLAVGCGHTSFLERLDGEVLPALRQARPELLVLSAGFDAWRGDPLGGLALELDTYAELGLRLGAFARESGLAIVALLEGGYDVEALAALADATLRGIEKGIDPKLPRGRR